MDATFSHNGVAGGVISFKILANSGSLEFGSFENPRLSTESIEQVRRVAASILVPLCALSSTGRQYFVFSLDRSDTNYQLIENTIYH